VIQRDTGGARSTENWPARLHAVAITCALAQSHGSTAHTLSAGGRKPRGRAANQTQKYIDRVQHQFGNTNKKKSMQVEEIMTKDVCSCSPEMNAATAAEIMWARNCGSLAIVEDGGPVVGIVTDRDLFLALGTSNRKPAELRVGEAMSKDPALCNPGNDVRDALKTMAQRQLRRLPVVDEVGALKGILSLGDIALRADDELSLDVLNAIRAICDRRNHRKAARRESFWSDQAAA
jgi:CBS domain-containing protein